MPRARIAAIAVLLAMPVGLLGAWAFNPDSGAVLHSEVLWRVFGSMFEGAGLLLLASSLLFGLGTLLRRVRTIGRPGGA